MTLEELHRNTQAKGYRHDLDRQFAPGPSGHGDDFGKIPQEVANESGLPALLLKIAHGEHRGPTNGYGIRHILLGHGIELAEDNWDSVQDFVLLVIDEFDAIYSDEERPNRWQLVRRAPTSQDNHWILVIEKHQSGAFYRIVTGWLREGSRKLKNTLVWERRDRSSGPGKSGLR